MTQCEGCPLVNPPCSDGVGNPHAKIAIVGRNPGRTEARTGIPFTGPSGELLDATLEDIGLKRNDLWITNAAMCHIEGDESPTEEMFAACRPRLIEELREVNPGIILTLGNDATQAMIGKEQGSVSKLIGTMQYLKDLDKWIIPTHHPAFILRGNVEAFDDMKDALERAGRLAKGEQPFPSPLPYDHVFYLTIPQSACLALDDLKDKKILAIDTETDTVNDPTRKLLLLQLGDGVDAWVFEADLLTDPSSVAYHMFKEMLEDKDYTWLLHNAAFDLQYIRQYWGEIEGTVEDTMMLALCLSEHLRHCGLKYLVNKYLSVPHYETEVHKYLTFKGATFSRIPRSVLVPYAGFDVIFTYQLYYKLLERVKEEGNYENLYPMLIECQKVFSEMQYYGIKVDPSYVETLRSEYEPLIESLLVKIQDHAYLKGYRASQIVKNAKSYEFLNPLSPVQLRYYVNTYEGFNTDTTGAKWLVANEGHEFIDMLARWKKVEHLVRVYVDGIVDDTWPDGKVHPGFVHGAVTGRTTIEHPPMQTIPSDDFAEQYHVMSVRRLFVAEPGYKFVHFDYSQLEIRVAWHITEDENLGKAVMQPDLHRYMASLVYKVPPEKVTDYQRGQSKTVTFGMLYGRQAPSIAVTMKVSVEEAQEFLDKFAGQFPAFYGWWENTKNLAIERGYLETEFGRRRRWNLITDEIVNEIGRQAVNFPIQSTATDLTLKSLIRVNKLLKERGIGRTLFGVHDSIEMQIREECVEEIAPVIEDIMVHPFEKTVAVFKVKMGVADNFAEASNA